MPLMGADSVEASGFMGRLRRLLAVVLCLLAVAAGCGGTEARAQDDTLRDLINALGKGNYSDTEKQVNAIAATGAAPRPASKSAASSSRRRFRPGWSGQRRHMARISAGIAAKFLSVMCR